MTTEITYMALKIGKRYQSKHPDFYREDDPFTIVSVGVTGNPGHTARMDTRFVYVIRYDDGELDSIPVEDEGGYDIHPIKARPRKKKVKIDREPLVP